MPATPSPATSSSPVMDYDQEQPQESSSHGMCAALLTDAPWNSKSVIAAAVATVGGLASWVADLTSPAVVGIGGSYLGGFFFGWAFRRFLKMAALITGGLLTCIYVLEDTGWIDFALVPGATKIRHAIRAGFPGTEGLPPKFSC